MNNPRSKKEMIKRGRALTQKPISDDYFQGGQDTESKLLPQIESLRAENKQYRDMLKIERNLVDENERLTAVCSRYEKAIRWALGESSEDTPDFPLVDGPPYYRWRTQLRLIADLRQHGAQEFIRDRS